MKSAVHPVDTGNPLIEISRLFVGTAQLDELVARKLLNEFDGEVVESFTVLSFVRRRILRR
jgi:hypothetical protein